MMTARRYFEGAWVLTVLAVAAACDGGGTSSRTSPVPETTASAKLTTRGTAPDEQARAAVYASQAAAYRQLSDQNKQAVAALTVDIATQADIAKQAKSTGTIGRQGAAGAVDEAALGPKSVRTKRQAAADLADHLAAAAQKAADFHAQKAAELAATATVAVRK
jgi:hypothetical protein